MAPRRRFVYKAWPSGSAKRKSSRDTVSHAKLPPKSQLSCNLSHNFGDSNFRRVSCEGPGGLHVSLSNDAVKINEDTSRSCDGNEKSVADDRKGTSHTQADWLSRDSSPDLRARLTRDNTYQSSTSPRDFPSDGRVLTGRDTSTLRPGSSQTTSDEDRFQRSPVSEAGMSSHRHCDNSQLRERGKREHQGSVLSLQKRKRGNTSYRHGSLQDDEGLPSSHKLARSLSRRRPSDGRITRDHKLRRSSSRDFPSDGRVLRGRDTSTSRPGSKRSPVGEAGMSSHRHYDNSQQRERGRRHHQESVSSLHNRKRSNTRYRCGSLHDDEGLPPKRRRVDDKQQGNASQYASNRCPGRSKERRALESICEKTDLEEAVLELMNKEERFKALLKSNEEIRPDLMKQIIHALHMLCSSKIYPANANSVLMYSTRTHFFNSHLSRFINQMPQDSSNIREGLVVLITQITDIFLKLLQQVGESVANDLPLPQLEIAVRELGKQNVIQQMEQINEKIQHVNNLKEEVLSKAKASTKGESIGDPPENFRDVSIIPQEKDFQHGARPFVRANVVNGRYENVDHYLDVQFRLLQEDLLIPLREGVRQLRSDRNPARPQGSNHGIAKDIRIYYDVNVLNPVCSTKGMVYRIRFDCRHKNVRRVPWRKSSRLKFGSLVCLSHDDFHTMFFATVENREPRDLQYGELEVRFENVEAADVNRFIKERESFEMVESEAYFEAYRHNLEALQKITEEELPFKEHIVHCRKEEIRPPKYIDETSTFDFSVIMPKEENDLTLGEDDNDSFTEVPVLDQHNWPSRESLGLNISQLRACKQALTKRFAVIQGPPGTGKTYVGLKIAHMLLHNAKVWQEDEQSPILMISYTNHALDQFLHGLLDVMPKKGEG